MKHGDLFQDDDGDWCLHIEAGSKLLVTDAEPMPDDGAGRLVIDSDRATYSRIYSPYTNHENRVKLNLFDILKELLK